MYNNYISFAKSVNKNNIQHIEFKKNSQYNAILEHVSFELGKEYLMLIENEFDNITFDNINDFVKINDKYGNPKLENFVNKDGKNVISSATSLRYIYHSLLILEHYKKSKLSSIVEIGCGYGGLFLAINYFSKLLSIKIDNYHLIDLPDICNLIYLYLELNKENIQINFSLYNCNEYGKNINENNLFLISNYCFTEIEDEHRKNYIKYLFDKIQNGLICWQTCFGLNINETRNLNKEIIKLVFEKPQTASYEHPNYFVYF
jgi:hypothetical protein